MRDDRVLAFSDNVARGTYSLSYLARATLPGQFTVAPPHGEEMYAPEVFGRGDTIKVTVKP